jgi:hypothetical protein
MRVFSENMFSQSCVAVAAPSLLTHKALQRSLPARCRGAFNSREVRFAFDHAYHILTHQPSHMASMKGQELAQWRGRSRLAGILRLDEVLAIRPPPPKKHKPARVHPKARNKKHKRPMRPPGREHMTAPGINRNHGGINKPRSGHTGSLLLVKACTHGCVRHVMGWHVLLWLCTDRFSAPLQIVVKAGKHSGAPCNRFCWFGSKLTSARVHPLQVHVHTEQGHVQVPNQGKHPSSARVPEEHAKAGSSFLLSGFWMSKHRLSAARQTCATDM